MTKTAVVLFNLGGPDEIGAVKPFLFNLFNDSAIIDLPQPFRWIAAKAITMKRAGKARGIYQQMGGKSPILEQTQAQASALEKQLKNHKVFVCMRYWNPMSDIVVKNVKNYAPDRIILLPLYPQYSTTTTASSLEDWKRAAEKIGLNVPTSAVCCFANDRGFHASHAKLLRDTYWRASEHGKPRILFSAHGLPQKIIDAGDPYQWQVEKTVSSILQILAIDEADYRICYQSRVGSLKWIGPSTEEEIIQAGADKKPLVVVPISFVSEHSETLVELDVDYRKLAQLENVPDYYRVPALSVEPIFIETLASLCAKAAEGGSACSFGGEHTCPQHFVPLSKRRAEENQAQKAA